MQYSTSPNYLDFYDNPTYYFTLSMENPSGKTREVIAETASTAFRNITSVTIDTVVGMSKRYSTGTATEFKIDIEEPYGVTLLDDMMSIAEKNNIRNALSIRYILTLKFVGHVGGTVVNPYENVVWEWPICITEVKTGVSSAGAKYNMTAVIFSDVGYSDILGILQRDYSLVGFNIEDTLSLLKDYVNIDWINSYPDDGAKPDEIDFNIVDEKMGKYTLVPDGTTIKTPTYNQNVTEVVFSKGTSIMKVIETLLCSTKEIQEKFINSTNVQNTTNENEKKTSFSEFFRVYSDVVLTDEYDKTRNTYKKRIIYNIMPYHTSDILQDKIDGNKSNTRLNNIITKNYLFKQYDYIFTGKNTQVLDFDMRFDFAYYVAIPRNKGVDGSSVAKPERSASATKPVEQQKKNIVNEFVTTSYVPGPVDAINNNNLVSLNDIENSIVEMSTVFSPLIVHGTSVEQTTSNNVQNSIGTAKDILASLFTIKKSPDMITLDIEIKGDPFWLEPNPLSSIGEDGKYTKKHLDAVSTHKHVYTKRGEVYFIFNALTPDISNIYGKKKNASALTGAYRVLTVKHTFSNGFFSQKLNAVRDVTITVNSLKKSLEIEKK